MRAHFHEEETTNPRLFDPAINRMLLGYVLRYRRRLAFALFCVLIITAATLSVPYLAKVIIDRYIIKQGYVVDKSRMPPGLEPELEKRLPRAVRLDERHYFLFQAQLSFFSRRQLERLAARGIVSQDKWSLIESPRLSDRLRQTLQQLAGQGKARLWGQQRYLLRPGAYGEFTNRELLQLRAADLRAIVRLSLAMIAIFAVQFLFSYLQIVTLMRLSQKSMADLRADLYRHLLSLEVAYFDRNPIGRLVNRVTNDIEALNEMFSSVLVTLFQDILILTGIITVMFFVNVQLAVAVAVSFPFLLLITLLFRVKVREAYRLIRTKIAELNAFLNENISGMRIVQIYVQELKQLGHFRKINREVYDANIRQLQVYALFRPLIDFFRWFTVASVLYFGGRLILADQISYGLVVMFLAYIGSFFEPIGDLSEKFDIMQSATAAGEKILSVLQAPARREQSEPAQFRLLRSRQGHHDGAAARLSGEIVFDDVWFGYNPGEWVLKGVSFCVKPQQTCAIVGGTGSGKTTIISLLARLYAPQRGTITIDGIDINEIPYEIVRANLATVMQEVFLFSRSLRENITLNAAYDEQTFRNVARMTHLDSFIGSLAGKEEEPVMERGAAFSAGERQLLAFARALYVNPSILVLDEATSNIDTETEKLIQDAIGRLIRGRTSIIIAHRLSTIRTSHTILALQDGRIVEQGDHVSLLAKKGVYHQLYNLQFSPG